MYVNDADTTPVPLEDTVDSRFVLIDPVTGTVVSNQVRLVRWDILNEEDQLAVLSTPQLAKVIAKKYGRSVYVPRNEAEASPRKLKAGHGF